MTDVIPFGRAGEVYLCASFPAVLYNFVMFCVDCDKFWVAFVSGGDRETTQDDEVRSDATTSKLSPAAADLLGDDCRL